MVSTSSSLTEAEWDVIAASSESRNLVKDMAHLVVSSGYKDGWKFVVWHMKPLWSKYLWLCASHIKSGGKL